MKKLLYILIFAVIIMTACCKDGYRAVEKVMPNQPEQLPQEFLSPKGVHVHALSQPSDLEFTIIDNAITKTITNTTKDFTDIFPVDEWKNWDRFKNHSEYRVWLMESETNIVPAENPTVRGCPIVRTFNSSTGYASGITVGFQIVNNKVTSVYPYMIIGRVVGDNLNNPACLTHMFDATYNEGEHFRASNNIVVWSEFAANDVHPRFN